MYPSETVLFGRARYPIQTAYEAAASATQCPTSFRFHSDSFAVVIGVKLPLIGFHGQADAKMPGMGIYAPRFGALIS